MKLALYPRLGGTDRLRVWLGLTDCKRPPSVQWRLDGQRLAPERVVTLRPLQPVRDDNLSEDGERRIYSGLYEIPGVTAGAAHQVKAIINDHENPEKREVLCRARTLPSEVPPQGLHILLCSCFHATEARAGGLLKTIASIRQRYPPDPNGRGPDLTLLMGDQVYLDLPTLEDLPEAPVLLARNFEKKYRTNWFDGDDGRNLVPILEAGPSVAVPDDHEFWNNYPHVSPIVGNSWSKAGRKNWRHAALACYQGFQAPAGIEPGDPVVFDIPPFSFFLADTRSARRERQLMTSKALNKLQSWSRKLEDNRRIGVFLSGQSLLAEKAGTLSGAITDWELPNYDDFDTVVDTLVHGRQPLLLLTGDVHWGRVVRARVSDSPNPETDLRPLSEIIVSPAALVTSVGKDTLAELGNTVAGWFGGGKRWPRHSKPKTTIGPFHRGYKKAAVFNTLLKLRGDQLGLLTLKADGRTTAEVRFWNIGDHEPAKCPEILHLSTP